MLARNLTDKTLEPSTPTSYASKAPTVVSLDMAGQDKRGEDAQRCEDTPAPGSQGLQGFKANEMDEGDNGDDVDVDVESQTLASRTMTPVQLSETGEKTEGGAQVQLPQSRKWLLLVCFSSALFIDVLCISAFYVLTDVIAKELSISFAQQSWVITSYAVTFAASLMLFGRVSDLFSAKIVFCAGFTCLAILSLIISFLPEKYSFFILRALAGISGAALIPSSYRLIVMIFEPHERGTAFTIYGMSGATSNVIGLLIAGVIDLIPNGGQMTSWRWFFRIVAILIFPVATSCLWIVPNPPPRAKSESSKTPEFSKIRRLDLVGTLMLLAAIILVILGLTLGAGSGGWSTASFLVPLIIGVFLFVAFFLWERRLPDECALIPSKTWRIPNFLLLIVLGLEAYAWWATCSLAMVEVFMVVHHESSILAAVRMLPLGIASLSANIVLITFPKLVNDKPRVTAVTGLLLGMVGYVLMTRPTEYVGQEYWRYMFPGFVLGSAGASIFFNAVNVATMQAAPPEMAGVAGAALQVSFQVGSAVAFAVQAGLFTVEPGNIENPTNVHTSFYFQLGWIVVWTIVLLLFWRTPDKVQNSEQAKHAAAPVGQEAKR